MKAENEVRVSLGPGVREHHELVKFDVRKKKCGLACFSFPPLTKVSHINCVCFSAELSTFCICGSLITGSILGLDAVSFLFLNEPPC